MSSYIQRNIQLVARKIDTWPISFSVPQFQSCVAISEVLKRNFLPTLVPQLFPKHKYLMNLGSQLEVNVNGQYGLAMMERSNLVSGCMMGQVQGRKGEATYWHVLLVFKHVSNFQSYSFPCTCTCVSHIHHCASSQHVHNSHHTTPTITYLPFSHPENVSYNTTHHISS